MIVRAARGSDAAEIAEIVIAGWRAAYHDILDASYINSAAFELARRQSWEPLARNGREGPGLIVAEKDGRVVGWASYGEPRQPEGPGVGELWGLYVHPNHWGIGAATALVDEVLRDLLAAGFEQAMLWVLRDNPRARARYERSGFIDTGRSRLRDFGEAGSATEVEMARPLAEDPTD